MLASALLPGSLAGHCGFWSLRQQKARLRRELRSQLHAGASALVLAAAGGPLDCSAALEAGGALTSTLACSPPRTYTRTSNLTRRLTVPTTALAAAKTRRKGRRSGGGDDEIPDEGDGGGFGGPPGGGDGDEWARWWWGGDDNGEPEGGPPRSLLQDVLFLWSVFCAISFVQTLQHVMRRGAPRGPPGVLAALSLQHLLPRGSAAAATVR